MNIFRSLISFTMFLACLTIASGTRAQQYVWHFTHSDRDTGSLFYSFSSVDCASSVCTAAGSTIDTSRNVTYPYKLLFFRSTDGGLTWIDQDPGLPLLRGNDDNVISKVQQIDSLNAVGIADSGIIVRTFDGGNTWVRQDIHSHGNVADVHFSDDSTGIVVIQDSTGKIEFTHDAGNSWTIAPFSPWIGTITCHSDGGSKFRVIAYGSGPVYSTNDNWLTVDSTPLIVSRQDSVHIVGNFNFRGLDTIVAQGATIVGDTAERPYLTSSIDGGMTWNSIDIPDISNYFADRQSLMSPLDSSVVFYGLWADVNIFLSMDHGISWKIIPMVFDTSYRPEAIGGIAMASGGHPIAIFPEVGTNALGFLGRGDLVSSSVEEEQFSIGYDNMYIYPNPALSSVTITSAEAGSSVHLFDILGREVLHGTVPASGLITLDVSSFPSGLYYISDGVTRAKFVKE
jgi:Secretion system C-terminal sorting domain